jgi:hypothetical protein
MTEHQQPETLSLPPEQRDVICVLGGRSGTSFVARALNILGVYLGPEDRMIAANPLNEAGFWEHHEIVALNNEILARHGVRWPQVVPLPHGWEKNPGLDDLRERALQLIRTEFAEAPIWGWKDPRTCATLSFWQALVPRMRYVLCFRNPVDTARSNADTLKFAEGQAGRKRLPELQERLYLTSLVNWLEFIRSMVNQTSGQPRIAVLYEDMIEQTESEFRRIARFIDRPGAGTNPSVLDSLRRLRNDRLRHHNTAPNDVLAEAALPLIAKNAFLTLRAHVAFEQEAWRAVACGRTEHTGNRPAVLADLEETPEVRQTVKEHVHKVILEHTPADAHVAVVSHGDPELLSGTGRRTQHFPQDERGKFLGHHPADSADAIHALRQAQARGAGFLVIPKRQLWWLEHYATWREHLESTHCRIYEGEHCVLYRLEAVVPH